MAFERSCGPCSGRGYYGIDNKDTCKVCGGSGMVTFSGDVAHYRSCSPCSGRGYYGIDNKDTCEVCKGHGLLARSSAIQGPPAYPPEKVMPVAGGGKVFIVHGHDELMKREVQLLLTRANLEEVVLHEKPDKGRTIIDKLIEEGRDAGYAVALLSPDDAQSDGTARARQNVILEVGYFLGLLGKSKVRLLMKPGVEVPSDLHGVLYQPFDESGAWRIKLLKEINESGLDVSLDAVAKKL